MNEPRQLDLFRDDPPKEFRFFWEPIRIVGEESERVTYSLYLFDESGEISYHMVGRGSE